MIEERVLVNGVLGIVLQRSDEAVLVYFGTSDNKMVTRWVPVEAAKPCTTEPPAETEGSVGES